MTATTNPRTAGRQGPVGFVGYLLVAATVSFGLLAAFTPFVLLAPIGVGLAVLLVRRHQTGAQLYGLVSGLSVVPLYLAWTNRRGPTSDCARGNEDHCPDLSSPWPWLTVGLLLLLAGVVTYLLLRRRATRVNALR